MSMDNMSIEGTVATAVGLQQANAMQEAQNVLLRRVLDNQAQAITSLLDAATVPQLSTYGMVGTQIHVTA
uniref:hypothetical protein n=1 Tax=Bordetella sputigena TaxID=1416810 RepID=UPI0039F088B5